MWRVSMTRELPGGERREGGAAAAAAAAAHLSTRVSLHIHIPRLTARPLEAGGWLAAHWYDETVTAVFQSPP